MLLWLGLAAAACVLAAYAFGLAHRPEAPKPTEATVGNALLALLGLLLAFSFSAAWSRYHDRLDLAVDEANALGTLTLRLDLLPTGSSSGARRALAEYVRSRQEFNESLAAAAGRPAPMPAPEAGSRLWSELFRASLSLDQAPDRALLLQAANEALDLGAKREVEARTHIPWPVALLLAAAAVLGGAVAGHATPRGSPVALAAGWAFAACVAATLLAVLDLEDPRAGVIRVGHADELLGKVGRQAAERAARTP